MIYVKRADWGARARKGGPTYLLKAEAKGIAVHYEGQPVNHDSHDLCDDRVRSTQNFHMDTRGWADIAYSWLVCRHGVIYEGRGWGIRTAAQGTNAGNAGYHAVCFLDGDGPGQDATPEVLSALTAVITETAALGWGADVRPHRYFHPTDCPGDELAAWLARGGWKPQGPGKAPVRPVQPLTPPAWYSRVLQVQTPLLRGQDVINVQNAVRVNPDGVYGPDTAAKVRGWQSLHGLTPDGVVGPNTAEKMHEAAQA